MIDLARRKLPKGTEIGRRIWKCFPIETQHIGPQIFEPTDFHQNLCNQIQKAKDRVYIASLYIGPAVDKAKYGREAEFLKALSKIQQSVDVRILMDANRGLRPVRAPTSTETRTSAQACKSHLKKDAKIFLLSVLDGPYRFLPNPLNEVAGVFHVKLYIIDDQVFLSGANLSQEYFSDRHDRYLWLKDGANGLVDMYADLIQALCDHGSCPFELSNKATNKMRPATENRDKLFQSLVEILTVAEEDSSLELDVDDKSVMAFAIPTFQVPQTYFRGVDTEKRSQLPTDVETIHGLLREIGRNMPSTLFNLRLASAYLNLTSEFMRASNKVNIHCLSAGHLSHGFRPKKVTGNQSKTDWIPVVFDHFAAQFPENIKVWYYQRENWTFHAKGLWLTATDPTVSSSSLAASTDEEMIAATHGSGNYGWRSEIRDMESNLILVFPRDNELSQRHTAEWNRMTQTYVVPRQEVHVLKALPWYIARALPYIKSYF